MIPKTVVLIVEDDPPIARFMDSVMSSQGYRTILADTGNSGLALAASWNPDLMLLDLGLPDMEGIELLRRLRVFSDMPVIVVSARHQDQEKVAALDGGADDYVTKPFSVAELLARVRVAIRHRDQPESAELPTGRYDNRELSIDLETRTVTVRGDIVHLTPIEYDILCLLSRHAGRVLTHRFILQEIRGSFQPDSDTQALRVFVSNLRKKIERNAADPEYILTEVGVGYRMVSE